MSALSAAEGVDVANAVSVAVARKALDSQEQQGEAAVELLRAAAEVGERARAQAAQGRGGVDVYA